jgi:hypothetical protein
LVQRPLEPLARREVEQLWDLSGQSRLLFRLCHEARGETATWQDIEAGVCDLLRRRLHALVAPHARGVGADSDGCARIASSVNAATIAPAPAGRSRM